MLKKIKMAIWAYKNEGLVWESLLIASDAMINAAEDLEQQGDGEDAEIAKKFRRDTDTIERFLSS